jgi:hypothetical protein
MIQQRFLLNYSVDGIVSNDAMFETLAVSTPMFKPPVALAVCAAVAIVATFAAPVG